MMIKSMISAAAGAVDSVGGTGGAVAGNKLLKKVEESSR